MKIKLNCNNQNKRLQNFLTISEKTIFNIFEQFLAISDWHNLKFVIKSIFLENNIITLDIGNRIMKLLSWNYEIARYVNVSNNVTDNFKNVSNFLLVFLTRKGDNLLNYYSKNESYIVVDTFLWTCSLWANLFG